MKRNADAQRAISTGTSRAMRRRAKNTQCPACKRKMALKRVRDSLGFIVATVCRYCKHEMAHDPYPPATESK